MSYKSECQEKYLPVGSVPTLFLSRHSAQPFERRSFFLPVVSLHCRDGAIRFLKQTSLTVSEARHTLVKVRLADELPSIFLVAAHCIVLDKAAKGVVAAGDPRKLRDESKIPYVYNFFTRSAPGMSAHKGG